MCNQTFHTKSNTRHVSFAVDLISQVIIIPRVEASAVADAFYQPEDIAQFKERDDMSKLLKKARKKARKLAFTLHGEREPHYDTFFLAADMTGIAVDVERLQAQEATKRTAAKTTLFKKQQKSRMLQSLPLHI